MSALLLGLALAQVAVAGEMERAVTDGVRRGVFPGAVVVVGTRDAVLYARGFGHLNWSASSAVPHPDSTLYDLASLTKVVATTPAIMLLVDRNRLDLDRPVVRYLPGFAGAGKEAVTVRHLLAHTSGLRAFLRLDTLARDAEAARRLVLEEPLRWKPGTRVEYSDLNAMLLGWIVEVVSGTTLDRFAAANIFGPLGFEHAGFNLAKRVYPRVAPTGLWRGHSIAGPVNDQNAARLGGVAGHAGLFATGLELARYAQVFLNQGRGPDGRRIFSPETVALFTRRQAGTRALGWEVRDTVTNGPAGRRLSPRAFGHTGFTGTSLWIDPERGLFVVVLTNRVYAPRVRNSMTRLREVRGRVADAAVTFIELGCGPVVGPPITCTGAAR